MVLDINMEEVMELEATMDKNTRKPSDLHAPKRPLTPYLLWANSVRSKFEKENPDVGVMAVGRELGKRWKSVPRSVIESFQETYSHLKKKYLAKMEKYKKTDNYKRFQAELLAFKIHQTKKPFGPDPNAPKQYKSAYMQYITSVRTQIVKENPKWSPEEIMREQSVWWNALSEEDRMPWHEKAAAAKKKFMRLVDKYHKTSDYQSYVTKKEAYKAQMIATRNRLMGIKPKKKKRARSEGKSARKAKKAKRTRASTSRSRSTVRRRASRSRRARASKSSKKRRAFEHGSKKSRRARTPSRRARTPKAPSRSSHSRSSVRSSRSRSSIRRTPRGNTETPKRIKMGPTAVSASRSRSMSFSC